MGRLAGIGCHLKNRPHDLWPNKEQKKNKKKSISDNNKTKKKQEATQKKKPIINSIK